MFCFSLIGRKQRAKRNCRRLADTGVIVVHDSVSTPYSGYVRRPIYVLCRIVLFVCLLVCLFICLFVRVFFNFCFVFTTPICYHDDILYSKQ